MNRPPGPCHTSTMASARVLIIDFDGVNSRQVSDAFNRIGTISTVISHHNASLDSLLDINPTAIVLSPCNLGESYQLDARLLCIDKPVLGICNGAQLIVTALGGTVTPGPRLETGLVQLRRRRASLLAIGTPRWQYVYMNHEHYITRLPKHARATARTERTQIAAFEIIRCPPLFGVQFHPESPGSRYGPQLLRQFVRCGKFYQTTGGRQNYSSESEAGRAR